MGAMDIPALAPSIVTPFRVTVGITLVNAAISLGFSIYEVVQADGETSLLYASGRSRTAMKLQPSSRYTWVCSISAGLNLTSNTGR